MFVVSFSFYVLWQVSLALLVRWDVYVLDQACYNFDFC